MTQAKQNRDDRLIDALAAGLPWSQAAEAAGVSPATLCRRLRAPEFRERVAEEAAARRDALTLALGDAAPWAVGKLRAIAEDPKVPGGVRVRALAVLLDAHGGWIETAELTGRLDVLERAAGLASRPLRAVPSS